MKIFNSVCINLSRFLEVVAIVSFMLLIGIDCNSPILIFKLVIFSGVCLLLAKILQDPFKFVTVFVSLDFCFRAAIGKEEYRYYLRRSGNVFNLFHRCMKTFNDDDLKEMIIHNNFRSRKVRHTRVFTL